MFEVLERAIEELEVPVDSAALARVLRLQDRLAAKVTMAVAAFDAAGLWDLEGDTSQTAWLRRNAGMTSRDATVVTRTARRLRAAPVVAGAWVAGAVSGGQVAAVVANVSDDTAALFAAHEAELVPRLAVLPVGDTATVMQAWAAAAADTLDQGGPHEPRRSLHVSTTLDGRTALDGDLDADAGQVVTTALRLATTRDAPDEPARTPGHRRADALVEVCRWFLDHQHATPGGRHRPHVNLVIDADKRAAGDPTAGRTSDGVTLDPTTVERHLCDASIHRVVMAGRSTILDYGTATRTIPAPLFNALAVRDRHCRWAGCDRPPSWCEAHHVHHWEHGGSTRPDNLVLLCARHHHRAHQPGWHVKLLPDATLHITTPTGTVLRTRPPP